MIIKKHKNKKKIVVLSAMVLALLLVAGASAFVVISRNNQDKVPSTVDKDSTSKQDKKKKLSFKNTPQSETSTPSKDVVQTESAVQGNSAETPNITRAEQVDNFIRVSAIFNNPSSGRCILRFEKQGKIALQQEVPVVVMASYYACNGFRVPASELPSKGAWDIVVVHDINRNTASARSSVNVQ